MTRKLFAFAMATLLLAACFSGAAGAEESPATPTDLGCAHEHTKITIYFYDAPAYTAVDGETHRVSGPALVETDCLDCGEVLSIEEVANAEEIRPHTFKKDTCVLCGFHAKKKQPERERVDAQGERTIYARKDDNADGLLTLTLSPADLTELENEQVQVVIVRPENGDAAIALPVQEVLTQTEKTGTDLYLQMAEREDGSFFAGLYLVSGSDWTEPEDDGITLRFYQKTKVNVRVSMAPADTDQLVETQSEWNDKGYYWAVPYVAEGTYFLLPR